MGTEQKVAIVTGASQGIGAGVVKALRDRNYRVIANSRSIKPANDDDILTIAGDIADPAVARRLVSEGLERFGRIDTLVNNAGIFIGSPFTQYTEEQFTSVVSTNLAGFFYVTQQAIQAMEIQGRGHIVNITASLVSDSSGNVPVVLAALTKGGLDSATRSLAIEYATRGIRVNAVAPGIIKTPMHEAATHEFLGKLHPVARMGDIADVVGAVLYLETAGFVTGEIVHVDGGLSAGH